MRERKIPGTTWVCPVCFQVPEEPCLGTLTGRKMAQKHDRQPVRHRDIVIAEKREAFAQLWDKETAVDMTERQKLLVGTQRKAGCRLDLRDHPCPCPDCRARMRAHIDGHRPLGQSIQELTNSVRTGTGQFSRCAP